MSVRWKAQRPTQPSSGSSGHKLNPQSEFIFSGVSTEHPSRFHWLP